MITIALPIGGSPDLTLLNEFFNNIKYNTPPPRVIVGMDCNTEDNAKRIIHDNVESNDILTFPEESFWRPGCIWYKIWCCWQHSDSDYLTWSGYDDVSYANRFDHSNNFLNATDDNYVGCYSEQIGWIDGIGSSPNSIRNTNINKSIVGSIPFPVGDILFKRKFLNQGRMQHDILKNAHGWEAYYVTWLLSLGPLARMPGLRFAYRNHPRTLSNTAASIDTENSKRVITGYSLDQLMEDWNSIKFHEFIDEVRSKPWI
jgi:hypothetical protein